MVIILRIYFILISLSFMYLFILSLIFLIKNKINNLGKRIYKFGHIDNKLINIITWLSLLFILNRIIYFYDIYKTFLNNSSENESQEIYMASFLMLIIIIILISIFFHYIKYKHIKIYEMGIISSIVSWKWSKIKNYEWLYKNNDIIGLVLYVKKNIFITWNGKIKYIISKKEKPYVKLLIEKYMYDYNIKCKSQNVA